MAFISEYYYCPPEGMLTRAIGDDHYRLSCEITGSYPPVEGCDGECAKWSWGWDAANAVRGGDQYAYSLADGTIVWCRDTAIVYIDRLWQSPNGYLNHSPEQQGYDEPYEVPCEDR